jgi:hypothetical protein
MPPKMEFGAFQLDICVFAVCPSHLCVVGKAEFRKYCK